jgi:bifunctional non-homologous end joining protein LigD
LHHHDQRRWHDADGVPAIVSAVQDHDLSIDHQCRGHH